MSLMLSNMMFAVFWFNISVRGCLDIYGSGTSDMPELSHENYGPPTMKTAWRPTFLVAKFRGDPICNCEMMG